MLFIMIITIIGTALASMCLNSFYHFAPSSLVKKCLSGDKHNPPPPPPFSSVQ